MEIRGEVYYSPARGDAVIVDGADMEGTEQVLLWLDGLLRTQLNSAREDDEFTVTLIVTGKE